jgi:MFS transporter, DHA1 family, inner membrane transport protein
LGETPWPGGYAVVTVQVSRIRLVAFLSAAVFLVRTVAMMMGPVLVAVAAAFDTSVAATGQLAAAMGITWGITAPLVGPLSDIYGRRKVGLTGLMVMAVGTLGSLLAWNYWELLVCRLLAGVGAAMIPPNSVAAIADRFAPAERGRPISVLISASFVALVIATPVVAVLGEMGGWRLPFIVVGVSIIGVWALQWYWLPEHPSVGRRFGFIAYFKEVGRNKGLWLVLLANFFYQTAALGIFTYLVAFLVRTYGMTQGDAALPLGVVGAGAILGSLLGGYVAGRKRRLSWAAFVLLLGGLSIGLAFSTGLRPWMAIMLCCAGALLLTIFEPVTWVLTAELAGESRATANGLLATSNQLGFIGGASVGGLMLSVGGYPLVGFFFLGAAIAAAVVVIGIGIGIKLRSAQAVRI